MNSSEESESSGETFIYGESNFSRVDAFAGFVFGAVISCVGIGLNLWTLLALGMSK